MHPGSASELAAWSQGRGSCPALFARPSWQPAVLAGCTNRALSDFALDAEPKYRTAGLSQLWRSAWLVVGRWHQSGNPNGCGTVYGCVRRRELWLGKSRIGGSLPAIFGNQPHSIPVGRGADTPN